MKDKTGGRAINSVTEDPPRGWSWPNPHPLATTDRIALTLGPDVANLTHGSHDARNAPRARVPNGSLFAWVPRRPRGSWETHHPSRTQSLPLGTHSYLCQLLWREGGRQRSL